jgi:subtilisin family serine protease
VRALLLASTLALGFAALSLTPTLAHESGPLPKSSAPVGGATRPKFRAVHGPKAAGQYIVVFPDDARPDRLAPALAHEHGGTLKRIFRHALRGAVMDGMTEGRARALADDPRVRWVEEDAVVSAAGVDDPAHSWGLDRIDQPTSALDQRYYYDFTGAGVTVYVIDTGIRTTHVELGGRATWGVNLVDSFDVDCSGHGTFVAGIVGANRFGVAKEASLVAVKVLGCDGSGLTSGVVAGVDWVSANATPPAVVNMSLGGEASDALDLAITNSVAAGIVYTAAAGNAHADACTTSPARAAGAITVAATESILYDNTADRLAPYSNLGPCVDVFAPGGVIRSILASSDVAEGSGQGTSISAPHVAGVAALLRQEFPAADPDTIRELLLDRAELGFVRGLEPWMVTPNLFLQSRATATPYLLVARDGEGGGTITSQPPVVDCGPTCHATIAPGTPVELTAEAAADSKFTGWSGACTGSGPCVLTMDRSTSARARFDRLFTTLHVALLGYSGASGSITSSPAGIACGTDCSEEYPGGSVVTLSAHPDRGSYLIQWEDNLGVYSSDPDTFHVPMSTSKTVTAIFVPYPVELDVAFAGAGSGTVTIDPRGTVCDQPCEEFFLMDRLVTLTAAHREGSCFAGWTGDCSGSVTECTLVTSVASATDRIRNVTATFEPTSAPACRLLFADGFESGTVGRWGAPMP